MMGDVYEVVSTVRLPIGERPSRKSHQVWYYGPVITLAAGTRLEFLNSVVTFLFGGLKVMKMKILDGEHKGKVVEIANRDELKHLKKISLKSTVN